MKTARFKILFISIFIILWSSSVFAGEDTRLYTEARKMAKAGQKDFAFMQYQTILRDYPASPFAEQALFGKGEYCFMIANYPQAEEAFQAFLQRYPKSSGRIFALAHLLSIARAQNNSAAAEKLEKEIITQKQVSLVFRDRKEYKYLSPLNQTYKAAIHIDKIEIYVGGELFAKISY